MKIVFATNNPNKLKEIQSLMHAGIEIISLKDIGCTEDIPETGETLEANAFQKARYLKEQYGYDCFADDTGLEVEALNGAPGVYSARYAGPERSAEANMAKILTELDGKENRKAQFRTAVALILNGEEHLFDGKVEGHISEDKQGEEGFGYDPIFLPENNLRSFAQMSMSEKGAISHRGRAVRKLVDFLRSI
ncbi:MAG: non-canonical purine NTP diphosphatase [Flavobacteriales bacterium]|jgi:XTP/dITP diphosphohydrolase|tara:strand:+ start:31 stop:606 length:576 start_codon:yes stop_codon:yes gene_type:complete